ncbi:hypothetical protein BURPS1710b_A2437 [Burkholderia pseudomallei 1710b]|uniref:Uncharacterized protein n=1 Tax=Burkholderia pseudomallei (strain 1710b) TaxID=320372 RepID=Q3JFR6_BURP1|nr:hypothetical protein BURPS1710b_A2437 [Burkholderia pseudomallei 1710b]
MRAQARAAVVERIVDLQQQYLVGAQPREVEPAVRGIRDDRIGLAHLVAIDEIARHQIVRRDRARVAQRERQPFDDVERTPDVDDREALPQARGRFVLGQMVAHAARRRRERLVVVHAPHRLAQRGRRARAVRAVAQRVIEDDDLFRARRRAQQRIDFRVVGRADRRVVGEIRERAAMPDELEAARIEPERARRRERARVANLHAARRELARRPRRAGRRLERVGHRARDAFRQVIDLRFDLAALPHRRPCFDDRAHCDYSSSERFVVRAQIEFLRPRAAVLHVQLPVAVGDRVGRQQPVGARLRDALGRRAAQPLAVDAAVDHRVRDVNTARAELARERLGERAQPRLRRRERGERRAAAQRCGRAREQQAARRVVARRAAVCVEQLRKRRLREQEAADHVRAPRVLELRDAQLERRRANCVARVEHGGPQRAERAHLDREPLDIGFARDVAARDVRDAALRADFVGDRGHALVRAPGQHDGVAAAREAPAKRRAEPGACADARDPRERNGTG